MPDPGTRRPQRFRTRLGLLLLCALAGGVAGFIGRSLSGSDAWYLALPAAIAAGWLFVGTPNECAPPKQDGPRTSR